LICPLFKSTKSLTKVKPRSEPFSPVVPCVLLFFCKEADIIKIIVWINFHVYLVAINKKLEELSFRVKPNYPFL